MAQRSWIHSNASHHSTFCSAGGKAFPTILYPLSSANLHLPHSLKLTEQPRSHFRFGFLSQLQASILTCARVREVTDVWRGGICLSSG